MTRADKITPGPVGVGTLFNSVMTGPGQATEMMIELMEFDRPRRITEKVHLSNMDIHGRLIFAPVGTATRMEWVWDLEPHRVIRLLGPLVRLMGDRQEREIWTSLKRFMEGRPAGPAGAAGAAR